MLVLSRKASEEIRIGDDIVIKVLSINGNRVRLGIKAPQDIPVLRGEVARHDDPDGGQTIVDIDVSEEDDTNNRKAA